MFTPREVLKIVAGSGIIGPPVRNFSGISTDSRNIRKGELFIPLKGPKFDGRKFIPEVLAKGALVLDAPNGTKALQDLAAYHRNRFKIPVIGVTGSVGKTTTKDMIASILSQKMPTLKNEENFNNEIGVPLTLLRLTKKHRAAVIEMGMQGPGEIEISSRIARPTIAVITNIGEAHLKYLRSRRNIARAKSEIFKHVKKGGWAVINQDDEYFEHLKDQAVRRSLRVLTFGILEKADVTPKELEGIELPIPGEHNIYNALAGIAVAKIIKIGKDSIRAGLHNFSPSSKRMQVIIRKKDKVKIINDTYNANPQSMAAALKTIAGMEGRKIAVLGEMYELGKQAAASHRKVLDLTKKLGIDAVFTYGTLWPKGPTRYPDKRSLVKKLNKFIRPRDTILVKGSRGTKMEEVVEALL